MKYNKLILINYLYILALEFIFKILVLHTYGIELMYISIIVFLLSIILTFITNISKSSKINRRLTKTMWIAIFSIFIAEVIYYSFYKTIFGYKAILYGGQVATFYSAIIEHILVNIPTIIIMFLCLFIVLKLSKKIEFNKFNLKNTLVLFIPLLILLLSSLEYNKNVINSPYTIFFKENNLMDFTNTFGVLPSFDMDILKSISNYQEKISLSNSIDNINDQDNNNEYNITDIDFDNVINNSNDDEVIKMSNYFKNQNPTNKNEYTGIFKGKNLIFITAEAFYPIAVDEKLTPTLYKLVHDGLYFTNYYQPIFNCSTSDGEYTNLLSLLPGTSTCSMDDTHNNYFPYNIGNAFKQYGYNSYAFHGWTYSYYRRDLTYPNLGFTYYGYDRYNKGYEYPLEGITDSWPTSDVDVINSSYKIYGNDPKYVAYYMSISGHLQYSFTDNAMSIKHEDEVKDLSASDTIKAYIAANIEFDKSLELLLNDLKESGTLDDTVIVIAPDHYPYGLTNDDIKSYIDIKDENFDLYHNNLIIYNSKLEHKEITKNIYSLDILPTLLNMFGIDYDSRLLIGSDIFSSSSDLVIFNNKSWISDKGRYNYLTKEFIPNDGISVDEDYIDKINDIVNTKFALSKLIIYKDYYRIVFGG